jgi:hypothetical protein
MATQKPSSAATPLPSVPPQIIKPKMPAPAVRAPAKKLVNLGSLPFWAGVALSALWVVVVLGVVAGSGPAHMFGGLPLVDWAIGISAIVSPVALVWMITAYLQRAADIQSVAEPLRRQLSLITGESGMAEARIRRFNQAIREQIDLLKNAQGMTQGDLTNIMDRVRQHRDELEQFENASIQQVKEVQEIVRRNMQQVEQLMDDKFTMLRVLDGKLLQNGDAVARQTEAVRDQIADLLGEIESQTGGVSEALSRAMQDSKKIADTTRAQEATLVGAAENVAETLNGLSTRIDMSVARFLERTGDAREEAERLAGALDAQTRSLDEFSQTLPSRVSEAESVIRGVADRLYASELLAREQAVSLSDNLSRQVDSLQDFMDRFTARLTDIDGGLAARKGDLESLASRIGAVSGDFVKSWAESIQDLSNRTDGTLERFASMNLQTRQEAETVVGRLDETTTRYESAALRVAKLSGDSREQMLAMTQEIATQLEQFEALHLSAQRASTEVESRANAALQNLQHVLERLLSARDATQGIGENLVKDLYAAVDQNEHLITRLSEATQMSVRAIGIATESFGQHQDSIATRTSDAEAVLRLAAEELQKKAAVAEQGLRKQAEELRVLLFETETRMGATEEKLHGLATTAIVPVQDVVRQIDASAEHGIETLARYGAGLGGQLTHLQHFHAEVGGMGERLSHVTRETLETIENLNNRFISVRGAQQETARQTLDQFSEFSDRLQNEVAGLEGHSALAVTNLQQAAAKIGEQAYQILQNAENSGAKMKLVTAVLQAEAAQIHSVLQKQTDDLGAELNHAEKQFAVLGEALQMRTENVHSLLDKVATHYADATRASSDIIENRSERFHQIASEAQNKSDTFVSALVQQITMMETSSSHLDAQTAVIGQATGKALQQLSALNEKLNITGEAANSNARQIAARLDETGTALMRQSNALSEAAQTSTSLIQSAGAVFGEQSGKLLETGHQIDQALRQLSASTVSYADQASQIRGAMEQQSQRVVTELTRTLTLIEDVGRKYDQTTATALQGADHVAARFDDMTKSAASQLIACHDDMQMVATKAESSLSGFGADVTQQAASLSIISEQLTDQYKSLASANENQKTQLVELFSKLGSAHGEASEVAERTIVRLTDSLNQMQRHLGLLSDQSQTTVGNVRAASGSFADQSALLIQNAQNAEQQARTVLSVTSALQDQARQLREAMQAESARAGDMLGALLNKLSMGNVDLRAMGTDATAVLTTLHGTIQEQTQSLTTDMQQIAERQRGLTTALDAQREVLNNLLGRLAIAQDETAAATDRASTRLSDGTQTIVRQTENMEQQARRSLDSIQAATGSFADESSRLVQHSQNAEQQARTVLSVTAALHEQSRQLSDAMRAESEQANDMLNSLLGRLATGGRELRDLSTNTEMSLNGLHNGVTQQSGELLALMQNIADRQRSLTTALDAQRDVLNGLLTRFNIAQDETAAVTERTATRMIESAQMVARQAEHIDATASNALIGVQNASGGFADQTSMLGLQAQQAEQHVRNVMSVTAGLQEQARQLREQMQSETTRAVEQLTTTIAQLDTTNNQLKLQTNTAINAMDQTVLQFATLAHTSSEAMSRQSVVLAETVESAESRLTQSSEKMRGQLKLVSDVGDQAESQARQLADIAECATTRLVTLRDTMADSDRDGQDILARVTARISDVKATLKEELERISDLSQIAVQNVAAATGTLVTQTDSLRTNLAMSESALSQAADLVREENSHLPALLNRSTTLIEQATTGLKAQTEEADGILINTADRFISVAMTARESMTDEMRRVTATVEQADSLLKQFGTTLNHQVSTIQSSTGVLTESQKELLAKAEESIAQLATSSDRLARLRHDATATAEKLLREFDTLDQRATVTSEKLASSGDTMVKTIDALAQVSQRAEAQMLGASSQYRDQLERIRGGLQGQIDDINRGLMQITAQLERTGNTLRSTTTGTAAEVERIVQRFDQTSKDAGNHLTEKTARMRGATEEVAKLLTGFGDQLDVLLDRLALAGDGLRRQEGGMVEHLQTALNHLGGIAERLEASRALATSVSEQTTSRLGEVVDTLHREMQELTNGSQAAAGIMRGIGQIYNEQTQGLNKGVREAHGQVMEMNKSVDDMQARTDRLRVSLKLQGQELMSSLEQILHQLATTGDVLSDTVDDVLRDQASANLKKIN